MENFIIEEDEMAKKCKTEFIKITADIFQDKRMLNLKYELIKIGQAPELASGLLVEGLFLAKKFKDNEYLIPINRFRDQLTYADLMIKSKMAEIVDDIFVYIKGSKEQFEWIKKAEEDGKKGWEKREENRQNELNKHMLTPPIGGVKGALGGVKGALPDRDRDIYSNTFIQDNIIKRESVCEIDLVEKKQSVDDVDLPSSWKIDFIETWNKYFSGTNIPCVKNLSDKRKRSLLKILKKHSTEEIQIVFQKIKESDFLQGRTKGRTFTCTFDFFVNENNFIKILEGNYDNRSDNNNTIDFTKLFKEAEEMKNEQRLF